MEEKNKDIVVDGQQETLLFQDACLMIVKRLAKALTNRYGEGFTKTNLYNYVGFYKTWPEIFHAVSGKSDESIESYIFHSLRGKSEDIMNALRAKSPIRLSWTHYRIILQENSKEARDWYEQEAAREIEQQKEFYRLQHKDDKDDGR